MKTLTYWISERNLRGIAPPADEPWFGESTLLFADGVAVPGSAYYPAAIGQWYRVAVPVDAYVGTLSLVFWDMTDTGFLVVDDIVVECDQEPMVVAGGNHSLALKYDGSLWSWGYNDCGQLGVGGEPFTQCVPGEIDDDKDWAMVAAGQSHTLAIKEDGTLWAWGDNEHGQLGLGHFGDNPMFDEDLPNQVGEDDDWAYVAAGLDFSLALKRDGTLWAWETTGPASSGNRPGRRRPPRRTTWIARTPGRWGKTATGPWRKAGAISFWRSKGTARCGVGATTPWTNWGWHRQTSTCTFQRESGPPPTGKP